jgi:hypothetical protein
VAQKNQNWVQFNELEVIIYVPTQLEVSNHHITVSDPNIPSMPLEVIVMEL